MAIYHCSHSQTIQDIRDLVFSTSFEQIENYLHSNGFHFSNASSNTLEDQWWYEKSNNEIKIEMMEVKKDKNDKYAPYILSYISSSEEDFYRLKKECDTNTAFQKIYEGIDEQGNFVRNYCNSIYGCSFMISSKLVNRTMYVVTIYNNPDCALKLKSLK